MNFAFTTDRLRVRLYPSAGESRPHNHPNGPRRCPVREAPCRQCGSFDSTFAAPRAKEDGNVFVFGLLSAPPFAFLRRGSRRSPVGNPPHFRSRQRKSGGQIYSEEIPAQVLFRTLWFFALFRVAGGLELSAHGFDAFSRLDSAEPPSHGRLSPIREGAPWPKGRPSGTCARFTQARWKY